MMLLRGCFAPTPGIMQDVVFFVIVSMICARFCQVWVARISATAQKAPHIYEQRRSAAGSAYVYRCKQSQRAKAQSTSYIGFELTTMHKSNYRGKTKCRMDWSFPYCLRYQKEETATGSRTISVTQTHSFALLFSQ